MNGETRSSPVILGAGDVEATGFRSAVDALAEALRGGLDPARSLPRSAVDVAAGQLLIMPASFGEYVAVKMVAVVPDNPARGLPRISGTLLLLDAVTLLPLAIMDGAAVTTLRTPAVSALATSLLLPADAPPARVVVFGSGPQAAGHLRALREVAALGRVRVIARDTGRAAALARELGAELSVDAAAGDTGDLADADIVVCATTASQPLFDAEAVRTGAVVVAVGSHQPGVLELPPALLAGAQVVVEDGASALREAGEVVAAVEDGLIDGSSLVPLLELATGVTPADYARTRVFKSMGMGWEDAVVAAAVWRRYRSAAASMGE